MEAKFLSSRFTRRSFLAGLGATAALPILAACQPQVVEKTVEVPVVVKETVVVEKVVEKEVVVEKPVEVVKQEIVEREKVVEIEKVVTAAPAMREPVTLRFSSWHGDFWVALAEIVMEKHPHLTMINESTPYGQYQSKLLTQAAGGVAAEVMMVNAPWQAALFRRNALVPFDDYLAGAGVDNRQWDADPWKACGWKGRTYGLSPAYQPMWQMVINRGLVEKAGVKMPPIWTLDGPTEGYDTWHWDDLVEFLKSLTKVTSAGKVEQYGLDMPFANSLYYNSLYMIYSNGGHLFDQDWEYAETETRVNTPEVIEALQNAVDLSEKHKVVPSVEEARAVKGGLFLAQKAAVQITHPGPASYREHIKSMELEFAPVPWYKHRIQFVGSNSYGINSAGPHQDDAALFAIAATTNEDVGWWFTSTINLIGYDMRAQMAKLPRDAYFLKIYENFLARDDKFSAYRPATENTKWMPRWAGRKPSLMRNTMNAEVEKVLLGEQTMKQAMANVQKKVDPELKKD
jgi:ABC-type glycerol-3-phosphate transport system substrate-binding protein